MDIMDAVSTGHDSITVKRVYGEAYERDGVTIIPAATLFGGAGGGQGDQPDGATGGGGGFGVHARPVGVFVIRGDQVSWQPVFDLNRVILGCQLLGLAAMLLTHRRLRKRS